MYICKSDADSLSSSMFSNESVEQEIGAQNESFGEIQCNVPNKSTDRKNFLNESQENVHCDVPNESTDDRNCLNENEEDVHCDVPNESTDENFLTESLEYIQHESQVNKNIARQSNRL